MDAREFRNAIGHFATGVTVVTTRVDGLVHGMTANAFSSLSLDPLLLLVCVDRRSNCWQQLQVADQFGISVLAADQEDLSNHFARPAEPGTDFGAVSIRDGQNGVPLIGDALATFECHKYEVLAGGDHDVFIGRVASAQVERPEPGPLLYYGGGYRHLAESE